MEKEIIEEVRGQRKLIHVVNIFDTKPDEILNLSLKSSTNNPTLESHQN